MTQHNIKPQSIVEALRWLISGYLRPHSALIAIIATAMLVQVLAILYFTRTIDPLTQTMFDNPQSAPAVFLSLSIFLTFLVRGLTSMIYRAGTEHVMSKATANIRRDLVTHLSNVEFGVFDTANQGDLSAKIGNNINEIRNMMVSTLSATVLGIVTIVFLTGYLIFVNFYLALIMVAAFGIVGLCLRMINRYIRRVREQALSSFSELSIEMDTFVTNQKGIRLNNLGFWMSNRLDDSIKRADLAARRHGYLLGILAPMTDITIGIAIAFVVVVAFYFLSSGQLEAGAMASFFAALLQLYSPIKRVTNLGGTLKALSVTIGSVRWILDLPSEGNKGFTKTASASTAPGTINFKNVAFRYPSSEGEQLVLEKFTASIPASGLTMVVGETGSGKSTLPSILFGLYDIQSGSVSIDDKPLDLTARQNLRSASSYVGQEIILLNESTSANIAPFNSGQNQQEIDQLLVELALANVELVKSDADLGPRGSKLSGGQRQRLAILQALLANKPFAIFDEPTSALDTNMAHKVVKTIRDQRIGKMTLMIVHDQSLLIHADTVINMDDLKL